MGIKGFQGKYGTSNGNGNSSEVTRDEENISSRGDYVVECNRADGRISQRWIHVRVEGAKGGNNNVSINVPIQMATAVLPAVSVSQHHSGNVNWQASVNGVDLRVLLDAVRSAPDNVSVTMERHDKEVSVAKSGQNLLIKIASKPTEDHHTGETVAIIKVPIPVVRALLTDNSDQLDVAAGIRALASQGDVDVTVNKEKETVRVWTDTRTTSD